MSYIDYNPCMRDTEGQKSALDYTLLGKRVREKRKESCLSQEELAFMLDSSSVYISRIENGKAHVSLEMLMRIAEALDVTADELLTGNQICTPIDYQTDIDLMMYDCSPQEKRILYEVMASVKKTLRENAH